MDATPPLAHGPALVFSTEYPAQQTSVAQALSRIRAEEWCRGAGPDLLSSLEIVLAEALNNVIEHACAGLDDRRFRLQCSFDGRTASVIVEDDGRPMPWSNPPKGRAPSLAVQTGDLPEGGFGWFLIRSICSDVNYTRSGSINRLSLRLHKV